MDGHPVRARHIGLLQKSTLNLHLNLGSSGASIGNVELMVQPGGGHAFDNSFSHFSQPVPAAAAWARTTDFLAAHLA